MKFEPRPFLLASDSQILVLCHISNTDYHIFDTFSLLFCVVSRNAKFGHIHYRREQQMTGIILFTVANCMATLIDMLNNVCLVYSFHDTGETLIIINEVQNDYVSMFEIILKRLCHYLWFTL